MEARRPRILARQVFRGNLGVKQGFDLQGTNINLITNAEGMSIVFIQRADGADVSIVLYNEISVYNATRGSDTCEAHLCSDRRHALTISGHLSQFRSPTLRLPKVTTKFDEAMVQPPSPLGTTPFEEEGDVRELVRGLFPRSTSFPQIQPATFFRRPATYLLLSSLSLLSTFNHSSFPIHLKILIHQLTFWISQASTTQAITLRYRRASFIVHYRASCGKTRVLDASKMIHLNLN